MAEKKSAAKRKPAAKKASAKNTVAQPDPARPADKVAGAARAEGRKRSREMRDALESFNSVQLKNFLKGMTPAAVARLAKALEKIEKEKVADAIKAKMKAVETLEKEIAELKKAQG